MTTPTRIYIVASPEGNVRLIESYSAASALQYALQGEWKVSPGKVSDVAKYVSNGIKVETHYSTGDQK